MNIFYLHSNPEECAKMHCDKHVIKMPLEVAQMACTNIRVFKALGRLPKKLTSEELRVVRSTPDRGVAIDDREVPYLPTHENHPCTIWMRSTRGNWDWAISYAEQLNEEYRYRYGKSGLKAWRVIEGLTPPEFEHKRLTAPALCLPDQYKCDDPVMSYRNFYLGEKAKIATWKRRRPPAWWIYD